MMLPFDLSKMTHLKEKSSYNRNYFKCGNTKAEILQICHEDHDFYEYYIVENETKTFLGCGEAVGEIELLAHFS